MQSFFTDYLDLLQDCHDKILQALDGLPAEALDWSPGPEMNSISVLVTHLTGAERFWIGDVANQDSSNRNRAAEFQVHDVGLENLKKRLDDSLAYTRNAAENSRLQELEVKRVTPDGREHTVTWALLHALEHSMLHLGQIQLTRQLWEQKQQEQGK